MSDRPSPTREQLDRYAAEFNRSQSLKYFGVSVSFPDMEHVRVDLEVKPEHLGGLGATAVNGGVLAAVFDLVIGCAPALVDPTRRTATIQLSMSFMRPVTGRRAHATARIESAGGSTLFVSSRLYDAEGRLCAQAQGVVRMSRLPWASGSSPAVN